MNARLDRLELVVRNLTDRILGEEITFDAIAEQEAAEQGVAYVAPPPAEPEAQPDVVRAIDETLARVLPHLIEDLRKQEPDQDVIAELKAKISAFDRRYMEQESIIQTLIDAADKLLQRLQTAEGRLDQHRDVINQNHASSVSAFVALSTAAETKLQKVG